jgi:C-terminal processing protease CtpA/Prc
LKDVYPYPENIAIIINDGCGSTTEQFLLAARQSKKVKFYGTTTKGVLDFSNMKSVNSPCQHYRLNFCVTKSLRIPENAIDGKGIEPDYYLDKNIDPSHWVEFVKNELNKN